VAMSSPSGLTGAPSALSQALELKTRPAIPSVGLQAPSFAAAPVMPAGYGQPVSSGGPAPRPELALPEPTVADLPSPAMPVNSSVEDAAPSMARVEARETRGEPAGQPPLLPGGGYAGTQGLARHALYRAEKEGWRVSSSKRGTKATATGGVSDHWVGSKDAWAFDFSNGTTAANDGGRKLARDIAARYGVKFVEDSYDSGGTVKVGDHKFRIQILYGAGVDHADHVHVGIKRVA
jgi:hypothetical protein